MFPFKSWSPFLRPDYSSIEVTSLDLSKLVEYITWGGEGEGLQGTQVSGQQKAPRDALRWMLGVRLVTTQCRQLFSTHRDRKGYKKKKNSQALSPSALKAAIPPNSVTPKEGASPRFEFFVWRIDRSWIPLAPMEQQRALLSVLSLGRWLSTNVKKKSMNRWYDGKSRFYVSCEMWGSGWSTGHPQKTQTHAGQESIP